MCKLGGRDDQEPHDHADYDHGDGMDSRVDKDLVEDARHRLPP